ncbi:MAG: 16S rRNA (guanine(966)-N(2))-methyltransferase RsmD [Limnochordaceae bacterium]|nr:16S rRNA (guanine(966)-N(2))-methyltransferase RsmD [Limnochordaceae bacterium]
MRVIAGIAKGRPLIVPAGRSVRPTTDRVRQSVMDILAPFTLERAWLDLFAGSGAMGIEALSRGARRAVFVEDDPAALRAIRANLERTGLGEKATVLRRDALRAIEELSRSGERFDVIFADPPYAAGLAEAVVRALAASGLAADDGVVVVQHGAREEPAAVAGWTVWRRARYGETTVTFLARGGEGLA